MLTDKNKKRNDYSGLSFKSLVLSETAANQNHCGLSQVPINFEFSIRIDPYIYSYEDRESLVTILFKSLNDEMLDRYTGKHLRESDLTGSEVLTSIYMGFRQEARISGWGAVEKYLRFSGTIMMLREMLAILAMRSYGNLKASYVYNTSEFQRMSRACDVLFDGNGKFLEPEPKFEAFLKRHKIALIKKSKTQTAPDCLWLKKGESL